MYVTNNIWFDLIPFFIHGCVLRQNCEWAHSLGWETTPHMNSLRMLYCWHDTGLMVALTLSYPDKLFFRLPHTIGKRIHQRKWLSQFSAVQSLYPLQNISLSLMFFLERSGFFAAILDTRPSSKIFASLCMQMHSHLPVAIPEQALYWWCPDPAAESTLGDGPDACWTFLGALKPSSHQLNSSPWSSWWSVKPFLCKAMMTARVSLQITMVDRGRTMIPSTTLLLKLPVCYSNSISMT